jgi:hypothetical protein
VNPRERSILLILAALAVLWGAVPALTDAFEGLFYLLPLFALVVPLLLGRYLGEDALETLRQRRRVARRARPARVIGAPARPGRVVVPRGNALLARHLAVRPPPAAVALT